MTLTWSHAFVNVKNLDVMLRFYTDVLGFRVNDAAEGMAFLTQLDDEHHQLAFREVAEEDVSRIGHFAFRVETLDEVRRFYAKLKAQDLPGRVLPITHGNTWSIYCQDPERNGIEIFCDTPWDAEQPFAEPWDPTLDRGALETYTKQLIEQRGTLTSNRRGQSTSIE